MTFPCPFGRYLYIRLTFGAGPAGNMLKKKIDELFIRIPNIFGIAHHILIAGFDADDRDHHERREQMLYRCRQVNLKLNENKCLFR